MSLEILEKARLFAQEAFTTRRPERLEEMIAEKVEAYFTCTVEDYATSREHWLRLLEAVHATLPEHQMEIRNAFALGDRVYMLLRLTASANESEAEPLDGDAIEETLMLRFADGKIIEAMTLFSRTLGQAEASGLPKIGWPIAPARE